MKSDWFFFPLGSILRALGGVPINRKERSQTVDRIKELLVRQGQMHIAITPRGDTLTSREVEEWLLPYRHSRWSPHRAGCTGLQAT